ncbi:hypothetical protein Poli38472_000599 [Pythium oligandrum]|uniref:Uncharacterized protein n=1 Tax=Pythium oligandrum TaxID=41045 RepID=A0A8K1FI94_PYTOL|nr:hypothetical protein Poli38472_000599 [Pythium oligandrum]|eukprot:TMW60557.1 hypothetical protein Poli38472_000599 [Pythium oligandrum]
MAMDPKVKAVRSQKERLENAIFKLMAKRVKLLDKAASDQHKILTLIETSPEEFCDALRVQCADSIAQIRQLQTEWMIIQNEMNATMRRIIRRRLRALFANEE